VQLRKDEAPEKAEFIPLQEVTKPIENRELLGVRKPTATNLKHGKNNSFSA
jgi:hypothetical protein